MEVHRFRVLFLSLLAVTVLPGCSMLGGRDDETVELAFFAPDEMPALTAGYPRNLFGVARIEGAAFQWDPRWCMRDGEAVHPSGEVPGTQTEGGTS